MPTPADDGEAIKVAHAVGWSTCKATRTGSLDTTRSLRTEKLNERFAFAFFGYIKEFDYRKYVKEVVLCEKCSSTKSK